MLVGCYGGEDMAGLLLSVQTTYQTFADAVTHAVLKHSLGQGTQADRQAMAVAMQNLITADYTLKKAIVAKISTLY
jgi:hypothetical protein